MARVTVKQLQEKIDELLDKNLELCDKLEAKADEVYEIKSEYRVKASNLQVREKDCEKKEIEYEQVKRLVSDAICMLEMLQAVKCPEWTSFHETYQFLDKDDRTPPEPDTLFHAINKILNTMRSAVAPPVNYDNNFARLR